MSELSTASVGAHPRGGHAPVRVRLGELTEGGLAPAILAIIERGVGHRPALAAEMTAEIELAFTDGYPPVRIVFGVRGVLVEDGPGESPDLRIVGSLADQVSLMVAPLLGGVPSPIGRRGRAALGMVAGRRLRIEGRLGLMRRFLRIIRI